MTVSTVSNDYCLENSTRIKYETIRNDWFYLRAEIDDILG